MEDKIQFKRHSKRCNRYLKKIINQSQIILVINEHDLIDIEEEESDNIDYLVMSKSMYVFCLYYKEKNIGLVCLDNIDWENKNCRLKCGFFSNYINLIDKEQLKDCFKYILEFVNNNFGIRRIYGIMSDKSFFIEEINEVLNKEGENTDKSMIYYGKIIEEN